MRTTSHHRPPASEPSAALAQRLHGLAASVRALTLAGALSLAMVPLVLALGPDTWLTLWLGEHGNHSLQWLHGELTTAVRLRMTAVALLPVSLSLALLWQLWCLFGQYLQGAVFSPASLTHLRRFGWLMLSLAVAEPLSRAAMSVAVSLDNPPGERMVVLSLGSYDYALILLSLVFVAIARVMAEAARVAEENEQFI